MTALLVELRGDVRDLFHVLSGRCESDRDHSLREKFPGWGQPLSATGGEDRQPASDGADPSIPFPVLSCADRDAVVSVAGDENLVELHGSVPF